MRKIVFAAAGGLLVLALVVWFLGSSNPYTPAGYVGYVTRGALFGKAKFVGLQTGPTSPGRGWLLAVDNVSITPYTYTEPFLGPEGVLAKDDLLVQFNVHIVFRIKPAMAREFFEQYSVLYADRNSDKIVADAYKNYVKEPLRTFARDEIQKHKALEVKGNITPIGGEILRRVLERTGASPFDVSSVVVGNIQYPPEVANAVANKLSETQRKEQAEVAIDTEKMIAKKRVAEAEGIAKAMDIITQKLTNQYLQHEAIEAQKAMVNSPNHTTIYIPVGPMGVPLTATFDAQGGAAKKAPAEQKQK